MNRIIASILLCGIMQFAKGQSITVHGNPPALQILNATELINGKYVDHNAFEITYPLLTILSRLDFYVRSEFATLSNGASTIPSDKIGIRVITPSGGADPERFLTTTDQRLFELSSGLLGGLSEGSFEVTLRYRLLGGSHLLNTETGNYSVNVFYRFTVD
jgi:hypothetical protein